MNSVRKLIGFFILLVIALPVLVAIIWAVGLTQAVVSPKVIEELPKNILKATPELIDDALLLAEDLDSHLRPERRAWLRAVKASGQDVRQLLQASGLNAWVETELAGTLTRISEVLRGKRDPEFVTLDFRPLKRALNHESFDAFYAAVLEKLPACTEDEADRWRREIEWQGDIDWDNLPACRPDADTSARLLAAARTDMDREVPDEVRVFEDTRGFPRRFNLAEIAVAFSFLLFLIPAGFILLGALVAARDRQEFFRWSGAFTLAGGLLTLGTVYLTHRFSGWMIDGFPGPFWDRVSWAEDVLYARLGSHITEWLRPVFGPVRDTAEVVAVVGLVVFALSFLVSRRDRRQPEPVAASSTEAPSAPEAQS